MAIAGYASRVTTQAVARGVNKGVFTITGTGGDLILSASHLAERSEPGVTVHQIDIAANGLTCIVTYSTKGQDDPTVVDNVNVVIQTVEADV